MPLLSLNELSRLTGKTRATVGRAVDGLQSEPGPKNAKLYDSKVALERIFGRKGEDGADFVTEAESRRLLNVAKREDVLLDMEIKRRQRIPLDVLNTVNEEAFTAIQAIVKANRGRVLSEALINDIFAELRNVPGRLKW